MTQRIDPSEGRALFGLNPAGYDEVRPDYPPWIYQRLRDAGALIDGSAALEIGPGSGIATRRLLEYGANPLTLIEPDARFAPLLESIFERSSAHCRLIQQSFEDAPLDHGVFDLVAAATSFHWLTQARGLGKTSNVLRPNGTVALWWNVFQQLGRNDTFHDATHALLEPLASSPSGDSAGVPFALDRTQREAGLADAGFERIEYTEACWTLTFTTPQIRTLYEGFSPVQRLPEDERTRLLDALSEISETRFGGRVERNMTTCLYLARTPRR